MARVEKLRVYPVKSLDGTDLDEVTIAAHGGLNGDREYGLFDADGEPITAKRDPRVHAIDATFDPGSHELGVRTGDGRRRSFDLDDECDAVAAWFGDHLETDVTVRRDAATGYVDRPSAGPSVVSTATLREVSSWYDDVTVEGLRRRLRANVEVGGVEAFWEDRFVGDASGFTIGSIEFEGVEPCVRCVVPERDPETGERNPEFRERFVERRRATFPSWVDHTEFSSDYALTLIADVPAADRGETIRVGDTVSAVD